MDDTIVALASGALPAAIAVMRVSGPEALAVAARLAGTLPPPRRAGLRSLRAADGALLDRALVLTMPGPASPTGEDVVELHLHGGRAVVRAVEQELVATAGVRRAEAGEFTRRALEHGRLDLTEVEGLADLLAAETEAQRRAAIRMADGAVQREITAMQRELLTVGARIEALLDFADEADVEETANLEQIRRDCGQLQARLDRWLSYPTVSRLHAGFAIVLAGPPNAGKSSLLNLLAGREAAIVTDIPGTTRDRIDVPVVRNGKAFRLTDTAGLVEATADRVEAIGIDRARMAMDEADIVLWLGDDDVPRGISTAIALNARCDLPGREGEREGRFSVSAHLQLGIEQLWSAIERIVEDRVPPSNEASVNDRQHALLAHARDAIAEVRQLDDPLLMAEQLRRAGAAFDQITGQGGVEALLDALFSRFCIGK